MRRLIPLITAIVAFVVVFVTYSLHSNGDESERLLRSAVSSPGKYSYAAVGLTTSRCHGNQLISKIKVYHLRPSSTRIEYISGPLKGVVAAEDGHASWRCDPVTRKMVVSQCCVNLDAGRQLDLLVANHTVDAQASADIAGRASTLLVVRTTSGTIRKRLWIDRSTFVTLRTEDYDSAGQVESSTEYRTITYVDTIPASLFKQGRCSGGMAVKCMDAKTISLPELVKAVGFQIRIPKYIPAGYRLDGYRVHNCPCARQHKSAYIRYTNGLSSISIFELPSNNSGCSCCSGMSASKSCCVKQGDCGQQASVTVDGRSIVVIGDLGQDELERIAKSFE